MKFLKPILVFFCIAILIVLIYFFTRPVYFNTSIDLFENIDDKDVKTIMFDNRENILKITNPSIIENIISWIQNNNEINEKRQFRKDYEQTPFLIFDNNDSRFTISLSWVMDNSWIELYITHNKTNKKQYYDINTIYDTDYYTSDHIFFEALQNAENYYSIESPKLNYFMLELDKLLEAENKISEIEILDIIKEVESIDF